MSAAVASVAWLLVCPSGIAAQRTSAQSNASSDVAAPSVPTNDGSTPLHAAVQAGDAEEVRRVIRSGVNVNAANRYGVRALSLAAMTSNVPIMEVLLEAGADPNSVFGDGEAVILTAARTGSVPVLRLLIKYGADVNAREGWFGETALMWAAAANHSEAVTVLVEAGADVNARSLKTDFPEQKFDIAGMLTTYLPQGSWTPLMYAARENAIESARALIQAKADLDLVDPDGSTALIIAIINAHYDLAAVLIDAGADPDIADRTGMTALYAAAEMNTLDMTISRPAPKVTSTLGAIEVARRLLEHGANPNAQLVEPVIQRHHTVGNPFMGAGATPLMRAAKNGDIALVRLLLEHGADITGRQKNGTTVLMAALQSGTSMFSQSNRSETGTVEVVELCLELGLDVNATNERGQTAVHLAASSGMDDMIRLLAKHGAKLDIRDGRGLTPLDVAQGKGGRPIFLQLRPQATTAAVIQELLGATR